MKSEVNTLLAKKFGANASIYTDDTPGIRNTEIRSSKKISAVKQESRSYSDWLPAADYRDWKRNRQQEVSEISRVRVSFG